jgi:hypothetical protein
VLWLETELNGVVELVSTWRGEDGPSSYAGKVKGAVEVHDQKTWGLLTRKHRLHLRRLFGEWISPFSGEFS